VLAETGKDGVITHSVYFGHNRFGIKMKLFSYFQDGLASVLDGFYAFWPQPVPGLEQLANCKIVSHRGEYDNRSVFENTLPAFDRACAAGVWGIEFDIRWTKDLRPVVIHDATLQRVFGMNLTVADVKLETLRSECPEVPTLSEVIQKFGKKLHLMVEIKDENYPEPAQQNQILRHCFSTVEPLIDYHLMSLTPQMLDLVTFVPASTFIPIAQWNLQRLSNLALEKNMRGVAGHYFLLNNALLARHHANGQKVGTGYPGSKNCLFREINRGVEWIFSNVAGKLQTIVNGLISAG
jgi:glycerophosphoryl diester phosphodiesterase